MHEPPQLQRAARRRAAIRALLVAPLLAWAAWAQTHEPQPAPTSQPASPAASKPAVQELVFAGTTIDNNSLAVPHDFKGKLVLVNFWATWCPVCKRELPVWNEAYEKYHSKGLEIVGVVTDRNRKRSLDLVRTFLEQNEIKWPLIYEEAPDLSVRYHVDTIPTSFLLNGDTGHVLFSGNVIRGAGLSRKIELLLGIKPPPETTTKPQRQRPHQGQPVKRGGGKQP